MVKVHEMARLAAKWRSRGVRPIWGPMHQPAPTPMDMLASLGELLPRACDLGAILLQHTPGSPVTGKHDGRIMNMKRMRGRNHRSGGGGGGGGGSGGGGGASQNIRHNSGGGVPLNRNHVFDSNGPDIRLRGTSQQLFEKYLQLGRDATSSGDRVMAEGYFQHAEHYFRILNAMNQAAQQNQPQNGQQQVQQPDGRGPQHGGGHRQRYQTDESAQAATPEPEEAESQTPGMGEQPEAREILISAAPPEG